MTTCFFAFLADPVASVAQPVQRLRGFKRVHLEPGESTKVAFTLRAEDLGFWTDRDAFVIEPGDLLLRMTDHTTTDQLTVTIEED